MLQSFQREVAAMATAQHPCLLQLKGATSTPPICIIMEWMPKGSLYHDLHHQKLLTPTLKSIAAYDIALGMQYLHQCQIVHRDLKSLNVLLDSNLHIRICDFGFSRHFSAYAEMSQNIGTPHWMAPELLKEKATYTNKIDIYAYGILLWEMATSFTPYSGMDGTTIIQQVLMNDIRPPLPFNLNPSIKTLITQCWDRNPDNRPTFDDILIYFRSGSVFFNDTDVTEFMEYIYNKNTDNIVTRTKNFVEGKITYSQFISDLKAIPNNYAEELYKALPYVPEKEKGEFASLFYDTPKMTEAMRYLRSLENRSLEFDALSRIIQDLPTGSPSLDEDIVITVAKNGFADHCIVYCKNPSLLALSMGICVRKGIDERLKVAIVDKCVLSLKQSDEKLQIASLRLLLSLKAFNRIEFTVLKEFLGKPALRNTAEIAIAAMGLHGQMVSNDLLETILELCKEYHKTGLLNAIHS